LKYFLEIKDFKKNLENSKARLIDCLLDSSVPLIQPLNTYRTLCYLFISSKIPV